MDNNFMNGQEGQPGGNPQPDMSQQPTGISLAKDTPQQPTGFSPAQDGLQQAGYGQPDMNMQQGYGQPDMNMQAGYGQPDMNMQAGYGQPDMNMQAGYGQPDMSMQAGYGQPDMNMQAGYGQPDMNMQQGYGQPDMNMQQGYGQPNMYAQPSGFNGGNGGSGKPPKVKKPMTKGKLAAIIGGSLAGVAAIVCGVIFIPKLFKSDKEVVIEAFENTFSSQTETSYITQEIGVNDIMDAYYQNGGEATASYSLDGIAGMPGTGGYTYEVNAKYDPNNKLVNSTMDFSYQNNSLYSLDLIGTDTTTYFLLKDIIDGYLAVPNDLSAFADSPIMEGVDASVLSGITFDYFGSTEESELNSGYISAAEGIWDSVSVEKQGTANVDVNGKSVKAKEYYVTLKEDDIRAAFNSLLSGISEMVAEDPSMLDGSGIDIDTFNQGIAQLQDMLPSLVRGDLVIKVYVADKKVVKIAANDKITVMYVDVNYDMYLDLGDDDLSGKCGLTVMGEEVGFKFEAYDIHGNANGKASVFAPGNVIDVTFNKTLTDSDKFINAETAVEVSYNASSVASCNIKSSFDKVGYAFSGNMDITVDGVDGVIAIDVDGGYRDVEKGVRYTMDINNIAISLDGTELVSLSGVTTIDTSGVTASNIDSSIRVYNLDTMTETDFENMLMDNADNIAAWTENFTNNSGLLGALLEMNFDEDDDYDYESWEDDDESWEDDDSYTEDDMTLKSGDHQVRILGCIGGCELDYACSYFIDYESDDLTVEYTLLEGASAEEVLQSLNETSIEDVEWSNNEAVDVDGETVMYSMISYTIYEMPVTAYRFVRQVADGVFLVANVSVYNGGDEYSVSDLANCLSGQYYTVIQ